MAVYSVWESHFPSGSALEGLEVTKAIWDDMPAYDAKCFVITRGDLTSAEMLQRFTANKKAIYRLTAAPGPYIYSVQQDRLDQRRH